MTVTLPLVVERVVAGGDGLARHPDGRVVFLPAALPGEEVDARVVSSKRDFVRAEVVAVRSPSALRREPPCPLLARGCGGCDWQHVDPAGQVALKLDIVREALRRTAHLDAAAVDAVEAGGAVPATAYRTTVRVAGDRHGRAGFRRARSNDVVAAPGCLVAHPLVAELLATVELAPGAEATLRAGVASEQRTAWCEAGTMRGLPADVRTGPGATVVERVLAHDLRVSAASFFQSGPAAAALLAQTVAAVAGEALADARHVVDAYGGIGLFAATVVPEHARLTVVESNPAACADARHNLTGRDVHVAQVEVEAWPAEPADVVIADPARAGLGRAGAASITATGAPVVVLVGCDPVAFARDTALLRDAGWELAAARVLDLFPHTHHVEVVGRFERRS